MTEAMLEFHSPLTLLREWRGTDAPLRELLVTGFTVDLAFLERHCVSPARGLGARVTVIADARQAVHEAVDVRHAGRAYQHGHGVCAGAFHPKLVVLLGDEEVWAAIGSGNPTMSGWGHNHELWLVLRGERHHGTAAQADLGTWLTELPDVVSMPSWIATTVTDIGRAVIPTEVDAAASQLRIFGNLHEPILDQLPTGPVEALRMTAPFFDSRGETARALVNRFQPAVVEVAVQETLSQYDGETLADAVSDVPQADFWFLDEERTRHGKLVEWLVNGGTTALVGSANLSRAAMLLTTELGGNCELVALATATERLFPRDTATDGDTVQALKTIPPSTEPGRRPLLELLGARQLADGIVIELLTTAAAPVTIETSPDATPGTWTAVHTIKDPVDGRNTVRFRAPERVGGAVRAYLQLDGEKHTSSEVFLTDTVRCRPRDESQDRPRLVRDYQLDEAFTDPQLASRFQADLLRLMSEVQTGQRPTIVRNVAAASQASVDDDDRWSRWIHEVERTFGPSLTGLIFPRLMSLPATGALGWSDGSDIDETELAEDEDENVVDDLPENPAGAHAQYIPPSLRQRWRAWARRLCRTVVESPVPVEYRMMAAQNYLNLLAAGVWGREESWRSELRDLAGVLVPMGEERDAVPEQALSFMDSLLAVCVALLYQDVEPHRGTERDLIFKSAWDNARETIARADLALAERYLYRPDVTHSRVAMESDVRQLIDLAKATAEDPDAETFALLRSEGLTVERIDGALVVDGEVRNPRLAAARVANRCEHRPAAVIARNDYKTTVILRDGRSLAVAETGSPVWRTYRLSPVTTPVSLLGEDRGLPRTSSSSPLQQPSPQIRAMAETAGVNLQHLLVAL